MILCLCRVEHLLDHIGQVLVMRLQHEKWGLGSNIVALQALLLASRTSIIVVIVAAVAPS